MNFTSRTGALEVPRSLFHTRLNWVSVELIKGKSIDGSFPRFQRHVAIIITCSPRRMVLNGIEGPSGNPLFLAHRLEAVPPAMIGLDPFRNEIRVLEPFAYSACNCASGLYGVSALTVTVE
ncbi:MAG TPA: hypothetical protein VHC00_04560 [Rhizobiaceae bacterium]|nr:hypothetical protein [Rhizobiaceae bacterium]